VPGGYFAPLSLGPKTLAWPHANQGGVTASNRRSRSNPIKSPQRSRHMNQILGPDNSFVIVRDGKKLVCYDAGEEARFIGGVDYALRAGEQFVLSISKAMSRSVVAINEVFKQHNIAVEIIADSDPRAIDYFFSALGGTTFGAVGGASVGTALWLALKSYKATAAADFFVPGLGPCIAVPAGILACLGAAVGSCATHWGLRIRFVRTALAVEVVPALGRSTTTLMPSLDTGIGHPAPAG
jgi:hypothetical protein